MTLVVNAKIDEIMINKKISSPHIIEKEYLGSKSLTKPIRKKIQNGNTIMIVPLDGDFPTKALPNGPSSPSMYPATGFRILTNPLNLLSKLRK